MSDQLSSDLASLRLSREETPASSQKPWVLVLCVIALAVVAWVFGVPYAQSKFFKPELAVSQIVLVSPSDADVQLTATGFVVAQKTSRVGAKIAGRIARMHVVQGSKVEAGQVIAELDAHDIEATLRTARSRVAVARAQVAVSKAELASANHKVDRERTLVEQNAAAPANAVDLQARAVELRARVEAAVANVKAAQAEVDALAVNLDYLRITAPISGTVINKPATEGELVGTMAATIVELVDFDSLSIEADVPEPRLHLIEIGNPAEIVLDAFPKQRHAGTVAEIVPVVNRGKATGTVKVTFAKPAARALPDMSARISFLKKEAQERTRVPPKLVVQASAVTDRDGSKIVFVFDNGVVRLKPVTLGDPVGNGFELVSGPPAGTKVVRDPPDDLSDGQEIKQQGAT